MGEAIYNTMGIMKKKLFSVIFSFSLFGFNALLINNAYCQKQSPAKPYDFSKDAPKSINDECDKAKSIFQRTHPKTLVNSAIRGGAGLKIECSWNGYLGPDSIRYWITYYRCFDVGFLTVLKANKEGKMILVWKSPDISSDRSSIQEPEDLTNDGKKEILFYRAPGNAGGPLDIYSWNGDSASLIGQFDSNSEFKDLDSDGIKEIISYGRAHAGETSVANEFYKWDGKNYKLYKTEKIPISVDDK